MLVGLIPTRPVSAHRKESQAFNTSATKNIDCSGSKWDPFQDDLGSGKKAELRRELRRRRKVSRTSDDKLSLRSKLLFGKSFTHVVGDWLRSMQRRNKKHDKYRSTSFCRVHISLSCS
eukprot:jgi/Bigna1/126178/aug1.2_g886